MINNKDIKNIQDESRNILEKFGSSLSRVHEVIKKEENREQFREEMRGQDCDDDFKKDFLIMLQNIMTSVLLLRKDIGTKA